MLELNLVVNAENMQKMKNHLRVSLSQVRSSLRCEALARGLGHGTYAALCSRIKHSKDVVCTIDGLAFREFLQSKEFHFSDAVVFEVAAIEALRHVANREPQLTMWGMGIGRPHSKTDGLRESISESNQRFLDERSRLVSREAVGGFLRSLCFLSGVRQTKTIRPKTGSYWLKHIAEKFPCHYPDGEKLGPDYVENGTFIAAALHLGFRMKTYHDEFGYYQPNVSFNMSEPQLVDLDVEFRPDGAKAQDRRRAR